MWADDQLCRIWGGSPLRTRAVPQVDPRRARIRELSDAARFYRRALNYYRKDWPLVATLLVVIGASTMLSLLMVWPMAVLVDSVLMPNTKDDFLHRLFLAPLPESRLGQIIGLAVAGVVLKLGAGPALHGPHDL